jgi:hypothetical protein
MGCQVGYSVIICCMHRQSFIGKEEERGTKWTYDGIHLIVWC